jgi:predicted negative regulator of RcsB-dependent stress response
MDEVITKLMEHGALGLIAGVALLFAWRFYQDAKTAHEARAALAEKFADRIIELTKAQNQVLDAIEQRLSD